jgi:hypothetical protein
MSSRQPKTEGALKDPGIVYGERFRPLRRTDGKSIVYDPELPVGKRTVGGRTFDKFEEACDYARALAAEEIPKQ